MYSTHIHAWTDLQVTDIILLQYIQVFFSFFFFRWWLDGVVVRALDSWSRGRGFDSDRGTIRATTLGKLFTPNVPLFTKQYNLVPCDGFHANAP